MRQRTGVSFTEIDSEGEAANAPTPVHEPLRGDGPAVLAVSCLDGMGDAARRYAALVGARALITLYVPGILDSGRLRGLARTCARELRALNNRGMEKHLLILDSVALAVLVGEAANACGPIAIPFWEGSRYVQPLIVGEGRMRQPPDARLLTSKTGLQFRT